MIYFFITLVIFIICGKCDSNDEKIFKEEKSIEILQILERMNQTNGEEPNEYIIISKKWRKIVD